MKKNYLVLAGLVWTFAATFQHSAHALETQIENGLLMFSGATSVSISGPDGYTYQNNVSEELASMTLSDLGIYVDGRYRYEAKEIAFGDAVLIDDAENGRSGVVRHDVQVYAIESGVFLVVDGILVNSAVVE